MKYEFSIEKRAGYLYCKIPDRPYDRKAFISYAQRILQESEKANITRILVDGLDVKGADLSTMERYFIGEKVAEVFAPKIKLAVAWPEKHINRFAETVALNRGGYMHVVATIQAAEKWLLNKL